MLETQHLGCVTTAWSGPLDQVDIPALRAAFAELMDRAGDLTQRSGYDQDDVLLERAVVVRDTTAGEVRNWVVALPLLGDAGDLIAALNASRSAANLGPCRPEEVVLEELHMRILRETNIPLPDLRVPWDATPDADA